MVAKNIELQTASDLLQNQTQNIKDQVDMAMKFRQEEIQKQQDQKQFERQQTLMKYQQTLAKGDINSADPFIRRKAIET